MQTRHHLAHHAVPLLAALALLAACSNGAEDDGLDAADDDAATAPEQADDDAATAPEQADDDDLAAGSIDDNEPSTDETDETDDVSNGVEGDPDGAEDSTDDSDEDEALEPGELPGRWGQDTNGDGIPDFLHEAVGQDPEEPRCAAGGDWPCPGVAGPEELGNGIVDGSVMVLLDVSGSMAEEVPGGVKIDLARDAVELFATTTAPATDLGILTFGNVGGIDPDDPEESCAGVEVLADLGAANHESTPGIIGGIAASGLTPLALALETAGAQFDGREGERNRIVLISDGLETCDGDPVAAAGALHEAGVEVVVDVVAFDLPPEEQEALAEVAAAGGGRLLPAATGEELQRAVTELTGDTLARWICVFAAAYREASCIDDLQPDLDAAYREAMDTDDLTPQEQAAVISHMSDVGRQRLATIDQLNTDLQRERDAMSAAFQAQLTQLAERYDDEVLATIVTPEETTAELLGLSVEEFRQLIQLDTMGQIEELLGDDQAVEELFEDLRQRFEAIGSETALLDCPFVAALLTDQPA